MVYLYSKNEKVKNKFDAQLITDLNYFIESNNSDSSEIFILDIDEFDSTNKVIEYFEKLPETLKVIAIIEKPKLAHGALLIKKGFKSYIGKELENETFKEVIDTVVSGNIWLYPQLMNFIVKHISLDNEEKDSAEILKNISQKEKEVALLVADGLSNKEIAKKLGVQIVTVKKHISHIFTKLEIRDRIALALLINK